MNEAITMTSISDYLIMTGFITLAILSPLWFPPILRGLFLIVGIISDTFRR
jgi:hypothetical protein